MIIEPIGLDTALYVTANMRAEDAREIFAARWDDDIERLAREAACRGPLAWAVGEGEPIACVGASQCWPGVYEAWMFATDRFPDIGFSLTRWVKRVMIPAVAGAGAHRVHCHTIEGHHEAHRWLEALGAMRESEKPMFGKGGETFYVYRWIA